MPLPTTKSRIGGNFKVSGLALFPLDFIKEPVVRDITFAYTPVGPGN